MAIERRAARVTGRVQGVSFRWYTMEEARRLGLTGWVRNETDGSVHLEAQGDATALDELGRWLQHGPPAARVDGVEVRDLDPVADEGPFDIWG